MTYTFSFLGEFAALATAPRIAIRRVGHWGVWQEVASKDRSSFKADRSLTIWQIDQRKPPIVCTRDLTFEFTACILYYNC
jgi:hypothetical protein